MTKQELEQAIENGESVWAIINKGWKNEAILEIKANDIEKVLKTTFLWNKKYYGNLKDIFKTKAEAEHYLKHANIRRTETLPFLTWEEIKHNKYMNFRGNDGYDYELQVFIGTMLDDNAIRLLNTSIGECVFSSYATEENFYKAYDKCVNLFRGCEDE